jgi:antitoxin (DNA-binding transcriptional repressor) of toxin-antitoxin stability system
MKFVAVRTLSMDPAKVWRDLAQEKELILTDQGRPFALLTPIGDATFDREVDAFHEARALNALRSLQAASVAEGTGDLSMEEIAVLVAKARQERGAGAL